MGVVSKRSHQAVTSAGTMKFTNWYCTHVLLFAVSFTWALHEIPAPTYQHWDPVTSHFFTCDQCPPGTFVQHHCNANRKTVCSPCPAHHYSENWHWDEKCQYCTVVCKEKQNFQHECNSTHNRLCKCMEGYHLEIEFCIKHSSCHSGYGVKKPGTSEDDTVCERCPEGYYSNELSATKPCIKHTNCAELGLRTSSPGTATCDAVCDTNEKDSSFPYFHNQLVCYTDITLCEEVVFQFIASQGLPAYQLAMLMDSLPGQKVDGRNIEMVKKICNPKQQTIHLLKLWMHQNKDQNKIYNLIQDMNQCERAVSRCPGFKNLTMDHFNVVKESLPGNKVKEEDIRWIVKTCDPKQYIPQLLSLWKAQNADQDTANALSQSVKKLGSQKVPRKLLQSLRRIANIFNSSAIHRIYQKMFLEIIKGSKSLKAKSLNE
ncbi:tumor necrosis factor receptor superfamily member 11B-like [Acipenser ruthenus]|uniref:tumor necrosis factor receptor superfamily member 11B-like n=1 Tax=Acipenser ruthenus TaxID=7906 RepID=UPI002740B8A7|nr:tumor necrosis factor receptor superfamily member 11B-like [Acipenser ruthenus]